jgi:hypothetical protein
MITTKILPLAVLIAAFLIHSGFQDEKDPLHKRTFNTSLSETRNGVVAKKVVADKMYFKNGKLFSDFIFDKFGYKWIRYRINKDSIFTDSTNTEVRFLDLEAIVTDESNQTVIINLVSTEWDLDGVIKITKNDKLKKYYDLAGREKGGKPKKIRKKKQETIDY